MADPNDPWLGTWEIDPATIDHQLGRPGRLATYNIEVSRDGGYRYTLDAEDAEGKPVQAACSGPIDGVVRKFPGGFALPLTRLDSSIESTLFRGGAVLDRWVREVSAAGASIQLTQFACGRTGAST